MDEADSPKQPIGPPTPIEPAETAAVTELIASEVTSSTFNEGWQTVDFPWAMSVDTIPCSQTAGLGEAVSPGVIRYSGAEISPGTTYVAIPSETLEAASAIGHRPAFEPTQERFQQLLQELERSHQTAQRQQILVETLTAQLGSSQERIAQLERDCALTQQRHNEQVQQVLQAESACRDLRLRLHRQQQQTLQFKAALEKCLEMPTAYGHPVATDVALSGDVATSAIAALPPKNPPVKPWSLVEGSLREPASAALRLLGKRLHPCVAQGDEGSETKFVAPFSGCLPDDETMSLATDQSALLESDDPQFVTHLMQLIFPAGAEPSSNNAADVVQSERLLDPSPFAETVLETEGADANALLTLNVSSPAVFVVPDRPSEQYQSDAGSGSPDAIASLAPTPLPHNHPTDPLWDDLATLIDPLLHSERANPAEANVGDRSAEPINPAQTSLAAFSSTDLVPLEKQPLLTSTAAIPPIFATDTAPSAATPLEASDATVSSQTGWTWRDRLVNAGKVARSTDREAAQTSKLLALSVAGQQVVQQPVSAPNSIALTPTAFALPPSPIVYPQRSTKKLASLAAVDLPTFPKR